MQDNKAVIVALLIITTLIILTLAVIILALLHKYQRATIKNNRDKADLKLGFENNMLLTRIEAQDQTLNYISKEIHDNITLDLTLAKLQLNLLLAEGSKRISRRKLVDTVKILTKAISNLSNLSKRLNSDLINEIGLIEATKIELEKVRSCASLQVNYMVSGNPVFLKDQKELVIFRIIQESLHNIIKHSDAEEVCLEFHYEKNFLQIRIFDNGKGFDKDSAILPKSSGIRNMQNRVALLNGEIHISSAPESGTQIQITIPIDIDEQRD